MAIEDAASLEDLLACISSKEEISKALQAFERTRMRRKAKVQDLSLHNLRLYHLEDGEEQRKRDSLQCEDNSLSPIWNNSKDQSWLYGHTISLDNASHHQQVYLPIDAQDTKQH